MFFPVIVIRDTEMNEEHIVGTNVHDVLYIDDDGKIAYRNLQNSGGLRDWYQFKGDRTAAYSDEALIKMVTFEELQEIYQEQMSRYEKKAAKFDKIIQAVFDEDE